MLSQTKIRIQGEAESEIVLIVDDEPNFVAQFQAYLRARGFRMLTAHSAEEALGCLKEYPVAIVVADQRMPGMNGVEMLSHIRETYPDTVRVLMTGHSDLEAVIGAINEGAIYRYVSKQALPEEIAAVVGQAREKYRSDLEIKRLLRANRRLLRMLAAEENLSAMGIFGREVAQKLEEILRGLSGYLFGEAGHADHASLDHAFRHLDYALQRIREVSMLLGEGSEEVGETFVVSELINEEKERLSQVLKRENIPVQLIVELDPRLPLLRYPLTAVRRILKEIMENGVLFSFRPASSVIVKARLITDEEDPRIAIEVQNGARENIGENTSKLFAPFYTSLGKIDFPKEAPLPKPGEYNLGPYHHYGLGLASARWMASRLGGEVTLQVRGGVCVTSLILPLSKE